MTIIMIEATAEELQANRSVLDTVQSVLNRFSENLVGSRFKFSEADVVRAIANMNQEDEEEEDESNDCKM